VIKVKKQFSYAVYAGDKLMATQKDGRQDRQQNPIQGNMNGKMRNIN